jgi:hypothetical protein
MIHSATEPKMKLPVVISVFLDQISQIYLICGMPRAIPLPVIADKWNHEIYPPCNGKYSIYMAALA